jgi:hypothetical protein
VSRPPAALTPAEWRKPRPYFNYRDYYVGLAVRGILVVAFGAIAALSWVYLRSARRAEKTPVLHKIKVHLPLLLAGTAAPVFMPSDFLPFDWDRRNGATLWTLLGFVRSCPASLTPVRARHCGRAPDRLPG